MHRHGQNIGISRKVVPQLEEDTNQSCHLVVLSYGTVLSNNMSLATVPRVILFSVISDGIRVVRFHIQVSILFITLTKVNPGHCVICTSGQYLVLELLSSCLMSNWVTTSKRKEIRNMYQNFLLGG